MKLIRGSGDQAAFISSTPSVNRAMNVARSTPNAAKRRDGPPVPMPRSSRPPLRRSIVVAAAANCSGSWTVLTSTATPSRSRSVHAAA